MKFTKMQTMKHPSFTLYGMAAGLILSLGSSCLAQDNPVVNKLFSDHMVLQRGMPVPVWGTAKSGTMITVKFGRQEKTAEADKDGKWMVRLDAMKTSIVPAKMIITATTGSAPANIADVLVGDVYLCGGQSNMEFTMKEIKADEDMAKANFPLIRHSKHGNGWNVCSPNTIGDFTGVGFYFGRRIHMETGIPIGLLNNSIGGSFIQSWIPPEGLEAVPVLKESEDKQRAGYGQFHTTHTQALMPFSIKGMLWYQGEANTVNGGDPNYFQEMKALITGLRCAWNEGAFPVCFVQLANTVGISANPADVDGEAIIRMHQFKSLGIINTGMAVAIDIGTVPNIHPPNKFDVGNRLALWALAKDYGRDNLVYSGPLYKSMKIEGAKIRIAFDHVGKGLMLGKKDGLNPVVKNPTGKLRHFAIAGKNKRWVWADAVIDGNRVVVSSPDVPKPVAVRYAHCNRVEGCNLYNEDGLPASPFCTEN